MLSKPKGGQVRAKPKTELGVLLEDAPHMPRSLALYLLIPLALVKAMPTAHSEVDLQTLVKNSPFGEGKAPGEKSGALEFRGVYVDQGVTYFSVYNPATKSSTWVAQGETSTGPINIAVKSYDEAGNVLVVDNNGQTVKMKLHESQILKMETAAQVQGEAKNFPGVTTDSNAGIATKDAKPNVTSEQAQAYREQMRQRWSDRQGGNNNRGANGNDASSTATTEKKSAKGADSTTGTTKGNGRNKDNVQ